MLRPSVAALRFVLPAQARPCLAQWMALLACPVTFKPSGCTSAQQGLNSMSMLRYVGFTW